MQRESQACWWPGKQFCGLESSLQTPFWRAIETRSFKPGDIALARGISLGDAGAVTMVPVSWTEMQCPISTSKEGRKVAKVMPE